MNDFISQTVSSVVMVTTSLMSVTEQCLQPAIFFYNKAFQNEINIKVRHTNLFKICKICILKYVLTSFELVI